MKMKAGKSIATLAPASSFGVVSRQRGRCLETGGGGSLTVSVPPISPGSEDAGAAEEAPSVCVRTNGGAEVSAAIGRSDRATVHVHTHKGVCLSGERGLN